MGPLILTDTIIAFLADYSWPLIVVVLGAVVAEVMRECYLAWIERVQTHA